MCIYLPRLEFFGLFADLTGMPLSPHYLKKFSEKILRIAKKCETSTIRLVLTPSIDMKLGKNNWPCTTIFFYMPLTPPYFENLKILKKNSQKKISGNSQTL